MAEWRGQVFPALELGPGCLVLGINGGPPRDWKVPKSLLRGWEELVANPSLGEGPLGASK